MTADDARGQSAEEPFEMACRAIVRVGAAEIPERLRDAFVDTHWRDILPCVTRGYAAFMDRQHAR